jgi:hypothetical protein
MTNGNLPEHWTVEQRKVEEYLLHPVNSRGKAGFFYGYGFSQDRWEELRDALLAHTQTATGTFQVASRFGTKYIVTGPLRTPRQGAAHPLVCTVWHRDSGSSVSRLITAYPA